MYKIVAPVLYEEPIVQNIGLFFLGVEQPSHGRNKSDDQANNISQSEFENGSETGTEGSIPYHKRHLLDLVKKLHIIRASSRTRLDKYYIEHSSKAHFDSASDLKYADCGRLARAELEGWFLAESLLKRLAEQSDSKFSCERALPLISFRRLTALTFAMWDDGRWALYEKEAGSLGSLVRRRDRERDKQTRGAHNSDEEEGCPHEVNEPASAYLRCESILSTFFAHTLGHQAVSLCHHTDFGLKIFKRLCITWGDVDEFNDLYPYHIEGLRVIHGTPQVDFMTIRNAGPSRMFVRYGQDFRYGRSPINWSHLCLMDSFDDSISSYIECHPDRLPDQFHADTTLRLDFCVLPNAEDPDITPDKAQIRAGIEAQQCAMDQLIKDDKEESDALEGGSTVIGCRRKHREALLLRMIPYDVYVGGDVPPCPGCGLKE